MTISYFEVKTTLVSGFSFFAIDFSLSCDSSPVSDFRFRVCCSARRRFSEGGRRFSFPEGILGRRGSAVLGRGASAWGRLRLVSDEDFVSFLMLSGVARLRFLSSGVFVFILFGRVKNVFFIKPISNF